MKLDNTNQLQTHLNTNKLKCKYKDSRSQDYNFEMSNEIGEDFANQMFPIDSSLEL